MQVEGGQWGREPLRIRERVEDGQSHVGHSHLRQDRPVYELHHRMHDALWMDDPIDLSGLQVEEPTGLDDLQSLVHQCGRIDGDLFPHDPRRVPKGLLWGDTAEALSRTLAKP